MISVSRLLSCSIVLLGAAGVARAATTSEIADCRRSVIEAAGEYPVVLVDAVAACHLARAKGRISAAVDCNDLSQAAAAMGVSFGAVLNPSIDDPGRACNGVSPAEASYTSCPVPCDSTSVVDWESVDSCMRCLLEAHVENFASTALGQASVPLSSDDLRCLKPLSQAGPKVLRAMLDANTDCLDENARPNSCLESDVEGRTSIARARSRIASRVSKRCATANFATIASCATSLEDAGCVLAAAQRHGTLLSYDASRMLGQVFAAPASSFVQVSADQYRQCGLGTDGALECWTAGGWIGVAAPPGAFTQVVAADWSCGVRPDGSIDCWDLDVCCGLEEQTVPPTGTFVQVSGSYGIKCAIRTDATLACWGFDYAFEGRTTPPAGSFIQVGSGSNHSCAVRTDGTVACWGHESEGQTLPPGGTFVQVEAGYYHSCGLRADGTVTCWGGNDYGQSSPPAGEFSQISIDGLSGCGVRTNGTLECWGHEFLTEPLGIFSSVSVNVDGACALRNDGKMICWSSAGSLERPQPEQTYSDVERGGAHHCAVRTDGALECEGYNNHGQATPPPGTFRSVSAGVRHTCGVHDDGTVECWGDNEYGQSTPPGGTFESLSSGYYHTCGLRADGAAECWGGNNYAQSSPPGGTFTSLGCGGEFSCGVRPDSSVDCWGYNSSGQDSPPGFSFTQVSAGRYYACGLTLGRGSVACWGSDTNGDIDPPFAGGPYRQVSTSPDGTSNRTCALRTDGSVDCWPFGGALPPPSTFSRIATGSSYACGIRTDDRLVCWSLSPSN